MATKEQHTIMLRPIEWALLVQMADAKEISASEMLGWLIMAQDKRNADATKRKEARNDWDD